MVGSWVLSKIWIIDLFSTLVGMLMSSSKLFIFSKEVHFNSGVRLLLELYRIVVIKHVAFFTIWAKLTMAFTYTGLLLNLYTSIFGCGCGFGFEQKFWRIDGFGKKGHRSADLYTPIHPPLYRNSHFQAFFRAKWWLLFIYTQTDAYTTYILSLGGFMAIHFVNEVALVVNGRPFLRFHRRLINAML